MRCIIIKFKENLTLKTMIGKSRKNTEIKQVWDVSNKPRIILKTISCDFTNLESMSPSIKPCRPMRSNLPPPKKKRYPKPGRGMLRTSWRKVNHIWNVSFNPMRLNNSSLIKGMLPLFGETMESYTWLVLVMVIWSFLTLKHSVFIDGTACTPLS